MKINEKAFVLLSDKICDTCKYCVNFRKFRTRFIVKDEHGEIPYNPGVMCNYDNMVVYSPRGMEMPMNNFVKEDDTCEKWVKK